MLRVILVGVGGGILFGIMDGVIHANPLAQELFEFYRPIARTSVVAPVGVAIDLVYGLVMAGLFIALYKCLPGASGWMRGISFALLAWFFRVLMNAASQWMMFNIPIEALAYMALAGLLEMLMIGLLYGLTLRPTS